MNNGGLGNGRLGNGRLGSDRLGSGMYMIGGQRNDKWAAGMEVCSGRGQMGSDRGQMASGSVREEQIKAVARRDRDFGKLSFWGGVSRGECRSY